MEAGDRHGKGVRIREGVKKRRKKRRWLLTRSMARGETLAAIAKEAGIASADPLGGIELAPRHKVGPEATGRVLENISHQPSDHQSQKES